MPGNAESDGTLSDHSKELVKARTLRRLATDFATSALAHGITHLKAGCALVGRNAEMTGRTGIGSRATKHRSWFAGLPGRGLAGVVTTAVGIPDASQVTALASWALGVTHDLTGSTTHASPAETHQATVLIVGLTAAEAVGLAMTVAGFTEATIAFDSGLTTAVADGGFLGRAAEVVVADAPGFDATFDRIALGVHSTFCDADLSAILASLATVTSDALVAGATVLVAHQPATAVFAGAPDEVLPLTKTALLVATACDLSDDGASTPVTDLTRFALAVGTAGYRVVRTTLPGAIAIFDDANLSNRATVAIPTAARHATATLTDLAPIAAPIGFAATATFASTAAFKADQITTTISAGIATSADDITVIVAPIRVLGTIGARFKGVGHDTAHT